MSNYCDSVDRQEAIASIAASNKHNTERQVAIGCFSCQDKCFSRERMLGCVDRLCARGTEKFVLSL